MEIKTIENRYNKAVASKSSKRYADVLKAELSTPDWIQELNSILNRVPNIQSYEDFEKARQELEALFNKICKKINAPGLDAFDAWIKECTKNATNAGKLKSFVEKKYEDYSSSIDNIIQLVEQFRKIDQNTLFKELLSDFVKKIRENVSKFVDKPAEYENAIDTFFTDINRELSGIIALSELSYKSREDFYSEEEKSSYTFYSTIIDGIIDHSQKLKPLNDQEKKSSLYLIASSRISSIKNALLLLKRTGVSESKDKLYQDCFLKFEKKMLDTSDDIYTHIKEFLNKSWEAFSEQYDTIHDFYEGKKLSFKTSIWSNIDNKKELDDLIVEYNNIISHNILPMLRAMTPDNIIKEVKNSANNINTLREHEKTTWENVKKMFNDFIKIKEEKKAMLERMLEKHSMLKAQFDSIYLENGSLATIKNGIKEIENGNSFLASLQEDGLLGDMIQYMSECQTTFEDFLKQSDLDKEIEWLKNTDLEISMSNVEKFDYGKIKKLLEEGLISLTITQEY